MLLLRSFIAADADAPNALISHWPIEQDSDDDALHALTLPLWKTLADDIE